MPREGKVIGGGHRLVFIVTAIEHHGANLVPATASSAKFAEVTPPVAEALNHRPPEDLLVPLLDASSTVLRFDLLVPVRRVDPAIAAPEELEHVRHPREHVGAAVAMNAER